MNSELDRVFEKQLALRKIKSQIEEATTFEEVIGIMEPHMPEKGISNDSHYARLYQELLKQTSTQRYPQPQPPSLRDYLEPYYYEKAVHVYDQINNKEQHLQIMGREWAGNVGHHILKKGLFNVVTEQNFAEQVTRARFETFLPKVPLGLNGGAIDKKDKWKMDFSAWK